MVRSGNQDQHFEEPRLSHDFRHNYDAQLEVRTVRQDGTDQQRHLQVSPPLPPSSLPHSCQLCGKLISCRRNLWKHMERVHFTNPAVRCSLCAKMFKNKYALKDHQRIYHGGLSEPAPATHHPPPPPPSAPSSGPVLLSRILHEIRHQPPLPEHARHSPIDAHSFPPPPSVLNRHTLEVNSAYARHSEKDDEANAAYVKVSVGHTLHSRRQEDSPPMGQAGVASHSEWH